MLSFLLHLSFSLTPSELRAHLQRTGRDVYRTPGNPSTVTVQIIAGISEYRSNLYTTQNARDYTVADILSVAGDISTTFSVDYNSLVGFLKPAQYSGLSKRVFFTFKMGMFDNRRNSHLQATVIKIFRVNGQKQINIRQVGVSADAFNLLALWDCPGCSVSFNMLGDQIQGLYNALEEEISGHLQAIKNI